MKKIIIILVFVIFIGFPLSVPAGEPVEQDTPAGYQSNIYLEYAKKAANWLKSLAAAEPNGAYKWPTTGSSHSYSSS